LKPFGQTVSKHLWEKHSVPAKDRSGLNALVLELKLPDPNTLPTSQDWSPAHPHLALQAGVVCLQCNYRTTSKDLLQRHLSKEHGQRSSEENLGRGKIWKEVSLQSWSQNGKRKFWIVEPAVDQDTAQSLFQSPRRQRRLAQVHRVEQERVAGRDQSTITTMLEDPLLSSNWMRRTGWVKMFSDTNRLTLLRLAQLPVENGEAFYLGEHDGIQIESKTEDESTIQRICLAVDRFFDRCEDTTHHTDHSLRCWLRSHYTGKAYKAPFELPSRTSTQKRYRRIWKKMVVFCIRAHLAGDHVRTEVIRLPFSNERKWATSKLWSDASTPLEAPINSDMDRSSFLEGTSHETSLPRSSTDRPTPDLRRSRTCGDPIATTPVFSCLSEMSDVDTDRAGGNVDSDDTDEEYLQESDFECGSSAAGIVSHIEDTDVEPSLALSANGRFSSASKSMPGVVLGHGDLLLESVAEFCTYLCKESFHDGKSSSTVMVYFAGILGISKDGTTFERPSNYTSKLSALVHCARLCLLEATLPRFEYPSLGRRARPRSGQTRLLNDMREAYFCHGNAAPVGELLSLRAYGRTVSRTDGPSFRVDWSDDGDIIKWHDGEISMVKFRQLGHRVLQMIDDLMGTMMSGFRAELDLHKLRDRMSDHLFRTGQTVYDPHISIYQKRCALIQHMAC
jgi:hypothetical protein